MVVGVKGTEGGCWCLYPFLPLPLPQTLTNPNIPELTLTCSGCNRGHCLNTPICPFGSTLDKSRRSTANMEIILSTLRKFFTVVSCQLSRLRLWLTDQAMKTIPFRVCVCGMCVCVCVCVCVWYVRVCACVGCVCIHMCV